jgi:hypothetical protein
MTDTRTCLLSGCDQPITIDGSMSCDGHQEEEAEFIADTAAMYAMEDARHVAGAIELLYQAAGAIDATIGNLEMLRDTENPSYGLSGLDGASEVRAAAVRLSNRVHEAVVRALQRPCERKG